jgi:NADH-quinone oxidoreductase subunit J
LRSGFARYLPFGIALVALLAGEIIFAEGAWSAGGLQLSRTAPTPDQVPNIQALGILIYTRYLYIFEGAGLVLLVALIGAVVLTHRKRGDVRSQKISDQNKRRPEDAVRNTQPVVGQGVQL